MRILVIKAIFSNSSSLLCETSKTTKLGKHPAILAKEVREFLEIESSSKELGSLQN